MAHRRKSSHPVCKTRRNLEVTVADVSTADDDDVSELLIINPRVFVLSSCDHNMCVSLLKISVV